MLMMLNRQRAVCPQINMRRTREVNAEAIAMSTCWTEDSMQGFDNIEARLMVMNVEGMGWQVLDDEVAFVKTGGIPGVKIKKKMIVGGGSR